MRLCGLPDGVLITDTPLLTLLAKFSWGSSETEDQALTAKHSTYNFGCMRQLTLPDGRSVQPNPPARAAAPTTCASQSKKPAAVGRRLPHPRADPRICRY